MLKLKPGEESTLLQLKIYIFAEIHTINILPVYRFRPVGDFHLMKSYLTQRDVITNRNVTCLFC